MAARSIEVNSSSNRDIHGSKEDWICSDPTCNNVNFAGHTNCNACGKEKESFVSSDNSKTIKQFGHEVGKAAAELSRGWFSGDYWECNSCGNVNWTRRHSCNMCNAAKFGDNEEQTSFNDQEPVQYTERRSNFDKDDDFGRKKKKYRSRMTPDEFRKIYLFLYNIFQFVGFMYIFIVLTIRYAKYGPDSVRSSYRALSPVLKVLHLIQTVEIICPLIGYTSGNVMFALLHLTNRLIFIFVMIDGDPRMQLKPVVLYLFLLYTSLEIIRYPYYMFKVFDLNMSILVWLRHTVWIALLPLIFFCEGAILFRSISYFEETGKFSMTLPNAANFSFYLPHFIRIYLLFCFFPVIYMVLTRSYRKRVAAMVYLQKCSKVD